jgi:hypothetical protein
MAQFLGISKIAYHLLCGVLTKGMQLWKLSVTLGKRGQLLKVRASRCGWEWEYCEPATIIHLPNLFQLCSCYADTFKITRPFIVFITTIALYMFSYSLFASILSKLYLPLDKPSVNWDTFAPHGLTPCLCIRLKGVEPKFWYSTAKNKHW